MSTQPRRALVLTDESARHPFRQSLPPHVCARVRDASRKRSVRDIIIEDWKSFLAIYCATFLTVSAFLA
ncbi:hypothetical protein ABVV53_04685 [Novosphingobium sp. RD2P27]|uniref:Uncharacterized protein n=1 Tax=Novosphingobium kalidii TaxID=3230299 RepID=A0ABV2CYT0_9SPHN